MYDQIPHFFHEFNFVNAEVDFQKLILSNQSGAWDQFNCEKVTVFLFVEDYIFFTTQAIQVKKVGPRGTSC